MKWIDVNTNEKPESYRLVLIAYKIPAQETSGMSVGYYKHKGDYGYFVSPASPMGAEFQAWSDCLGDEFKPFGWQMNQVKDLR